MSRHRFLLLFVCLPALAGCSVEARKAKHLARADHYFDAGEYEMARVEYMSVLRLSFKDPKAIKRLGLIWLAEGVPLRAYPYLLQSRELDPDDLAARAKLAGLLSALGELRDARKEALSILQESPGNEEALLVLADTVRSDDDIRQTQEQLRKVPEGNDVAYHLAWATLASRGLEIGYLKSELEAALAADPRSVRAHLMMGTLYSSQGDRSSAEREFRMAVGLAPPGSEAWLQYAQFEKDNGALNEARALLTQTLKSAPHYQAARILLAQIAFEEEKWDECNELLEAVLDVDFVNIDALILRAQVQLAKGEMKQAADTLEHLDQAYPNVPFIKYQLARAYDKNNQMAQALIALDEAIAGNPDYVDAILFRGELQLRTANSTPVVTGMLALLAKRPGLRQAQDLLAEAYRVWGRLDDAAAVLRNEINDAPQSARAYISLGIVLAQAKKTDEAQQALEKAMQLAPGDVTAFAHLVTFYVSIDNLGAAEQLVRRQLAQTPDSPVAQFAEAKVCAARKDWDRAEAALQKTIALDPNIPAAYELAVSGYIATGKTAAAIQQLQSLLAKNPDDLRSLMTLALIYDRQRDFKKARGIYEKVLSVDPNFIAALNNLSSLFADQFNDPSKAYELARKARILEPGNPAAADALGWALYRQGNYQEALSLIEESSRASGNEAKVQFHLGMASYMMAEVERARGAFKNAASAPIDSPDKQEAQRWLAYLEDDSGAPKTLSMNELQNLIQQRPNDVIARVRLGRLYEQEGAPAKAAAEYNAAISVNPRLGEAMMKLAELYCGPLHDPAKALEFAKNARDIDSDSPRVLAVLGKAAFLNANCQWAYNLLQQAARQLPNEPRVAIDSAWAAYSLGKISEARDLMQKTQSAAPPKLADEIKLFLAMTAPGLENADSSAESSIRSTLRSDPDYVPALVAQAAIEAERGQKAAASEIYTKILHRFPDFVPARKRLIALYRDDSKPSDEIYELASKAHDALPEDKEISEILGEFSYHRKNFTLAAGLLQQSLDKKTPNARALYFLGMSELQLRRESESKRALEKSLELGLREPLASEAKRALESLSGL